MKKLSWNNIKEYEKKRKERRVRILEERRNSRWGKRLQPIYKVMNQWSLAMHIFLAMLINFIIEACSRHSIRAALEYLVKSPKVFLYNVLIIALTFSVVYLVRRRVFLRTFLIVMWLLLGVANGYMLAKRVTPFNAQDLKTIGEGFSIFRSYVSVGEMVLVPLSVLAVILLIIYMWRRCGRYEGKLNLKFVVPGIALSIGFLAVITQVAIESRVISTYFGNIAFAYRDYGTPYCFATSVFGTGIAQPYEYSEAEMKRIEEVSNLRDISYDENMTPNIIFVQLESFFDVTEVSFLQLSEDALPNFRKMSEEYSTGYFQSPSIGAGTANTEFEVLTGMNLRSFGPGEYPYKTVLKDQAAESLATALGECGYGAHALHNNGGNFYSRATVFNNIGFDTYISKEFMNIVEVTENGWAKDDILIEHVGEALDSTEHQDFVFAISVQGHGSYPEEPLLTDPKITVGDNLDEARKNAWEYYVNQIYEMDQFVADLVESIEKRGEPSVIVFYGDHLPTMNLQEEDLKSRNLFNTNYVIWDNIGLEKKDKIIPSYQLGAEILDRLSINSGTFFNYHQARRLTAGYLSDLESLQYDVLYGKQYVYEDEVPFRVGNMKMGLRNVTLTEIVENLDESYIIYGENFTEASKVYVNGEKQSTIFLDKTALKLSKEKLEDNDIVYVNQLGSGSTVFRSSKEYVYYAGNLTEMYRRTWSEE